MSLESARERVKLAGQEYEAGLIAFLEMTSDFEDIVIDFGVQVVLDALPAEIARKVAEFYASAEIDYGAMGVSSNGAYVVPDALVTAIKTYQADVRGRK